MYRCVAASKYVKPFKMLADADVGIVTGANKFFLVTDEIVKKYRMNEVAHPMFGRSEHCPGVVYDYMQHEINAKAGYPTNFLYFKEENDSIKYENYLSTAEKEGIPQRYKCRIRKPWYKVPSVYATSISMLKRSNGVPRLILNKMKAYTTDTAYRITPKEGIEDEKLVYCFINSITALSAELEGRFYGGGVLELVPSEIDRLLIPYIPKVKAHINELDSSIKNDNILDVLHRQDKSIFSLCEDIDFGDIEILNEALTRLQMRRQRKSE